MIDAKDLKVGNVFIRELHTSRGLEYDHEFILTENEMGKLFGDNLSLALQDLHGVPLTEDILLKCEGFEKTGENFFVGHLGNRLIYDGEDWCYLLLADQPYIVAYLKHLHQLQNLFYFLSGKELTVQL